MHHHLSFLRHPIARRALSPIKQADDAATGMSYDVNEAARHLRDLMDYRGNNRVGLEDLKALASAAGADRLRRIVQELTQAKQDPVNTPGKPVQEPEGTSNEPDYTIDDPTGMTQVPDLRSGVDTPSGTGHGPPMWSENTSYS